MRDLLLVAALAPMLALGTAARADDRALCGRPGLDLTCETVGAGFHALPQRLGSLRNFYVTMHALPDGPAGPVGRPAAPATVVYGGSGYTTVWGADSRTGGPDGSVAFWSGTAKVARLFAGRGTIAVGTNDATDQSSYLDMRAGDGVAFAADSDVVVLGPRTTVEAYYDGLPSHSFQSVLGYGRHGATTRIVTNRAFVRRTVSRELGTCFWWTGYDSICLTRYEATRPIAIYVDRTGGMRKVVGAGRSPATAEAADSRLAEVLGAQAKLRPTFY